MASIGCLNSRAIVNARGRLGSYFPVSMAFTVCRDTLSRPARSAWDHSRSARRTRRRFFIAHQPAGNPLCCAGSSVPPARKRVRGSPEQQRNASYHVPRWVADSRLLNDAENESHHESQHKRNRCGFKIDAPLHLVHLQGGTHERRQKAEIRQNRQQAHPPRNLGVLEKPCNHDYSDRGSNRPEEDWARESRRKCSICSHKR